MAPSRASSERLGECVISLHYTYIYSGVFCVCAGCEQLLGRKRGRVTLFEGGGREVKRRQKNLRRVSRAAGFFFFWEKSYPFDVCCSALCVFVSGRLGVEQLVASGRFPSHRLAQRSWRLEAGSRFIPFGNHCLWNLLRHSPIAFILICHHVRHA